MKYVFQELIEEEIFKLSPEQLQTKIAEFKKIYKALNNNSEILSTKLKPILKKNLNEILSHFKIKDISIVPNNNNFNSEFKTYNRNYSICIDGYNVNNNWHKIPLIYSKNGERIALYAFEEKIYNKLDPFEFFIKDSINFNVNELKSKYSNQTSQISKENKQFKDYQIGSLNKKNNREYEFKELTKEEIQNLTLEQIETEMRKTGEIYNALNRMLIKFIERKTAEIVVDYDIETIDINVRHKYNNINNTHYHIISVNFDNLDKLDYEAPKYSENTEDINFSNLRYSDLEKNIIKKIKPLVSYSKKNISISFNVDELRTKHMYSKLERDIQAKNYLIKSLHYKM